jgi:hypothetical protein
MTKLNFTYETLPSEWASALINNDWSGLEQNEESKLALENWLKLNSDLNCVYCEDEDFFSSYHDAMQVFNYSTNCLEFCFIVKN